MARDTLGWDWKSSQGWRPTLQEQESHLGAKFTVIYPYLSMGFVFFKIFFLKWTIIKVFIEFVIVLLLFWFFGHEVCGILAP